MAEVMQDLDSAAEDVGIERAAPTVDMDSLIYSGMQRALRIMHTNGQAMDQLLMTQFTACWIDAFVVGLNFEKRRQERLS
jgi:SHS2 domain-containing protein